MTKRDFATIIEKAKSVQMTPQQQELQRRSFAYGNAYAENEDVTREMVDRAAEQRNRDRSRR